MTVLCSTGVGSGCGTVQLAARFLTAPRSAVPNPVVIANFYPNDVVQCRCSSMFYKGKK